jgi:hypothetical protein
MTSTMMVFRRSIFIAADLSQYVYRNMKGKGSRSILRGEVA